MEKFQQSEGKQKFVFLRRGRYCNPLQSDLANFENLSKFNDHVCNFIFILIHWFI